MSQITGTSQYLSSLIHIVNEEMPLLEYNIGNASTIFTQQECLKQLHKIVLYMIHHNIIAAGGSPDPVQQAVPPGIAALQRQNGNSLQLPRFPTSGNQNPSPDPMIPGPSDVAEVVMTPGGTRVIPPRGSGPVLSVPQGSPVDATFGQPRRGNYPAQPLPATNPDGTPNIVVQPAMTDETRAALAAAGVTT
jgi:hypothetical protein